MPSSTHIALLRGINVGGKNKLPMKDLARLFTEAGCCNVRTYIQSGNVVFNANAGLARRVGSVIEKSIARGLGLQVPVVTRSAAELASVASAHPFAARPQAEPKKLHVAFLSKAPAAFRIAKLDPARSPPDELDVRGREIYLFCPNGIARTKLTNDYFDATLEVTSTVRNWNTVLKLLDLARD